MHFMKKQCTLIGMTVMIWELAFPGSAAEPPHATVVIGGLLEAEGGQWDPESSPLKTPFGVDFDRSGNMFIAELEGGRVHRLLENGRLVRVAGTGGKGYEGDGGPATDATFNGMHNLAVSDSGELFIADTWNHAVRRIDPYTGHIASFAGNGQAAFSGDGGPASGARFNYVMCITLNPRGNHLYVADLRNYRVRAIDLKSTIVRTIVGNGTRGVPVDGTVATESPLIDPRAVAVDSRDRLYVLERNGHALRVVTPDGKIRTVAGTGKAGKADGPALAAELNAPKHLCIDTDDNVIIADESNGLIRKYDPVRKTLSTILGGGRGDPPIRLSHPHGVCVEKNTLYIVDTGHNRVLKLPNG